MQSFAALCVPPASHQLVKYMQENNHFPKPNEYLYVVDFSSSRFNVQGHILSTSRDALSANYQKGLCNIKKMTCILDKGLS